MSITSCKKEYSKIERPAATTSGKNTLSCIINDSTYIPYVYFGWRQRIKFISDYNEKDSTYTLETLNTEHFNYISHVHLNLDGVYQEGTYPLRDNHKDFTYASPNKICYYRSNPESGKCLYWLDSTLGKNEVNVTNFDSVGEIISGTFNFVAVSHDSIDTVYVTDGRFDAQWHYDRR